MLSAHLSMRSAPFSLRFCHCNGGGLCCPCQVGKEIKEVAELQQIPKALFTSGSSTAAKIRLGYTMSERWPRSEQMHLKRAKSRVLRSSTCPQIILHGQWRSPRFCFQTRLSRIRQSFSRLRRAEYANLPAEEDESVDGSTEVEDADAAKEIKAEADAARAEGDQQDNPLWCKVSYYM